MLKESIKYYLERGNQAMYCCSLDLSKAYDRVSYYKLFRKHLDIGCPVYCVRLLYTWYSSQEIRVKWRHSLSEPFGSRNGLRQRSVLSPSLFNVYLNELLCELHKSGDGARVEGVYVGCLAYADDICLLSPTVLGMQKMLNTCDVYGKSHNLVFNYKKSAAITFVKNRFTKFFDPEFTLGGNILSCHKTVTHLGVVSDRCCRDASDIESRTRKFFGAVNSTAAKLGGFCTSDEAWKRIVDHKLFPVLVYGSHLWDTDRKSTMRGVDLAYRKGIRRG